MRQILLNPIIGNCNIRIVVFDVELFGVCTYEEERPNVTSPKKIRGKCVLNILAIP